MVWDNISDPAHPALIPIETFIQKFQHESYLSRAQQTFPIHAVECEPCRKGVEIVFTMDTSGSMDDEAAALCGSISAVQSTLMAAGIPSTTHLLGIAQTLGGGLSCLTNSVAGLLGTAVPGDGGACGSSLDHSESWGQSSAIVAQKFPWQPDVLRLVVPISDEASCKGDPCQDPGADRDAINNAVLQSAGTAMVSPIIGTPWDPSQAMCIRGLATDLANGTGGTFLESTDAAQLPAIVEKLVKKACRKD